MIFISQQPLDFAVQRACLHGDGCDDVLGVDEAWHSQVLDALGAKDGRARVKPGHVVGLVQQLRNHNACAALCKI